MMFSSLFFPCNGRNMLKRRKIEILLWLWQVILANIWMKYNYFATRSGKYTTDQWDDATSSVWKEIMMASSWSSFFTILRIEISRPTVFDGQKEFYAFILLPTSDPLVHRCLSIWSTRMNLTIEGRWVHISSPEALICSSMPCDRKACNWSQETSYFNSYLQILLVI